MIRSATQDDLPILRTLLTGANDAPYDIGAVAEEKLFGHGLTGEPVVRVFEDQGRALGLAVRRGRYLRLLAVDRAARRRGIGTALLRDSGARVIAAEPGNYFTPGVWDRDHGTTSFLHSSGYRERTATWNLFADTGGEPHEFQSGKAPPSLLAFVEKEFSAAWRFETERGSAVWADGIGFAAYEANNRGLGTFGPTGVSVSMRGQGYGGRLARAALSRLHELGFARAIIPWTDAADYYARWCGAKPAHRFVTFAIDSAP